MLRATPAELSWRRLGPALVAIVLTASAFVVGPSAPEAQALPNPCNLPGGEYLCKKAVQGTIWLDENTPLLDAARKVDSAADAVSSAADFASDPFGYIEAKVRGGTQGMFDAFGEELTGKRPSAPKNGVKGKGD
ncbi:hypothetical protein OG613_48760 (plasmid) [Streptomyces sp. NBC_00015]|uniref:hypothetical protein n=1 Tax=Streptomyces sp. NBC_00015 TaxID=2903611 RepID=UPI002F9152E6